MSFESGKLKQDNMRTIGSIEDKSMQMKPIEVKSSNNMSLEKDEDQFERAEETNESPIITKKPMMTAAVTNNQITSVVKEEAFLEAKPSSRLDEALGSGADLAAAPVQPGSARSGNQEKKVKDGEALAMDTGEREAAKWDNFGGITDTEGKDAEEEGEEEYENESEEFDYGEDDDFADFKHFSEKIDNEGGIKALDDVVVKRGDEKKSDNEVFDEDLNELAGEADLIDIDDLFTADNGEKDQMQANAKAKD